MTRRLVIEPNRTAGLQSFFTVEFPLQLLIPTPSIVVETKKDATAPELQEFCFQSPIAVIRGLSAALKLDLGLFSTKTLVGQAPEQQVEIRTQVLNAPDDNVDIHGTKSWRCESHRSYTTVAKYAKYQAETFTQAMIVSFFSLHSKKLRYVLYCCI